MRKCKDVVTECDTTCSAVSRSVQQCTSERAANARIYSPGMFAYQFQLQCRPFPWITSLLARWEAACGHRPPCISITACSQCVTRVHSLPFEQKRPMRLRCERKRRICQKYQVMHSTATFLPLSRSSGVSTQTDICLTSYAMQYLPSMQL